jgi:uncharacterized protein (DUF952 family)
VEWDAGNRPEDSVVELIYHLVAPSVWQQAPDQDYRADSLVSEGFIHCSRAHQVAGAANRFYADQPALLVLTIDPQRLQAPLRYEPAASGELFPHIHGPLNRTAVLGVQALARGADGHWVFPP